MYWYLSNCRWINIVCKFYIARIQFNNVFVVSERSTSIQMNHFKCCHIIKIKGCVDEILKSSGKSPFTSVVYTVFVSVKMVKTKIKFIRSRDTDHICLNDIQWYASIKAFQIDFFEFNKWTLKHRLNFDFWI